MAGSGRNDSLFLFDLTDRDRQLLRMLQPVVERQLDRIVDEFCGQLRRYGDASPLMEKAGTERLREVHRDYLLRLLEADFGEAYLAARRRIGRTHEEIKLGPRSYLAACSCYLRILAPLVYELHAADARAAGETILALEKVLMLDAALALEAYIASDRHRHLQQLESIFNDSADVIFLLDADKRFRAWNQAAERILGWPAAEILGQPVTIIVPPALLQAGELEQIDKEIATHGQCHLETVRLAKDGRRVPVELTLSVLRDPQGQPVGRSVILRDITERKRLEEAKLQSERLAVIGAMSAKLAHEIRNPLSSIRLNLDLVGDEFKSLSSFCPEAAGEAGGLLRAIEAEVMRIQRVTEDYLLFARMPKPHWEQVALNEVLAQGLAFMQSLFETSRVAVRAEFDPALPAVRGDEEQLWQAVLNIVRNALEAMPDGGTLIVRTTGDGTGVALSIADTGKGMTDEEHRQIFRPFFSTKTGGTGLGLPLAQQIISEHGGVIECETAAGRGTTFTIRLPRRQETRSDESKHSVG